MTTPATQGAPGVLAQDDWQSRRDAHHARVDALVADHRWRAERGIAHPIDDFLWEYYTFRPYQLRRWHPGAGVVLTGDVAAYAALADYRTVATGAQGPRMPDGGAGAPGTGAGVPDAGAAEGVTVDVERLVAKRGTTIARSIALLEATRDRVPKFDCFGMHEWAMVHGQQRHRHPLPLRLGQQGTDEVVEDLGARCTHYDAFRFFTASARPLNDRVLSRADQVDHEQPGCLHVSMDLYRLAYKASPLVPSELVVDCFELARDIRVLDMAASPYDCTAYGVEPVPVETPAGRAAYVAAQREFRERAVPLRGQLLAALMSI